MTPQFNPEPAPYSPIFHPVGSPVPIAYRVGNNEFIAVQNHVVGKHSAAMVSLGYFYTTLGSGHRPDKDRHVFLYHDELQALIEVLQQILAASRGKVGRDGHA